MRKNGSYCAAKAGASGFCFAHDPTRGRERAQARRLGGRNRRRVLNDTPFPECDAKTAQGLTVFLDALLRETWTLERGIARSRTLAYIAQVQKGIVESSEIETRLTALEAAVLRGEK
ncbi:MAG: hypothetical protein KGJ80_09680 [Chloroflexota bacterium]|nr:hypothetical protein [Chloroflexota bacterium]